MMHSTDMCVSSPQAAGAQALVPLITSKSKVTQSSIYYGDHRFVPEKAINGITKGDVSDITATNCEANPWWEVVVPNVSVSRIKIWNRQDCCKERLYGAKIKLNLADGTWKTVATYPSDPSASKEFNIGRVDGVKRIKVVVEGHHKWLSLSEVQAWGPVNTW